MPITASEMLFKLSTVSGSAGNTGASSSGNSLGKYVSTTALTATTLTAGDNNLFPDITGAQNAASESSYACVFIHNSHATLTAQNVKVYLSGEVASGATVSIGADTTAASAVGASTAQALQVSNATTAPSGVSFSAPTTDGAGVSLGNIAPGQVKAFWVRRDAANTAPLAQDGVFFNVAFDTEA